MKRVLAIYLICIGLFVAGGQLLAVLAGGTYSDSGQSLGGDNSYDVALADVDGDDDLDAVVANSSGNRVWFNSGGGFFTFTGSSVGVADSRGLATGDLNGDMQPDVFVANLDADNEVWLNQGNGTFLATGQVMSPTAMSYGVALADLNGDSSLDAFVVQDGGNEVWLNGGTAVFANTQSGLGSSVSRKAVLGDVNGDTFVDAYVANGTTSAQADELWLNDGSGFFTPTLQTLDTDWNEGAALGDVDGDDDLDVVVAAWFGNSSVWLNQGGLQGGTAGEFQDSGQILGSGSSLDIVLVDVDDDGDLDAIIAKWTPDADELWLNDGSGQFTLSAETLDGNATYAIAAGDLDGDFDHDLIFGNFGGNTVWFKGGFGLPSASFNVDARQNAAGQTIYPWAQPGDANLPVELSYAPPGAVDVVAQIETAVAVTTQTLPFAGGQQTDNLTVANPQPMPNETVTLTLDVAASSRLLSESREQVNPLQLMFVDASQGDVFCSLCFIDWLLQLLGFEPTFWQLHHMQLADIRDTPTWLYYQTGFAAHAEEISTIMATNPTLLWQTADTLETWTPAMKAYDEGLGSTVTVTQPMVDQLVTMAEGVRDAAGAPLATRIQSELDALDMDTWVGSNMDEVAAVVGGRIQGQVYLPFVVEP